MVFEVVRSINGEDYVTINCGANYSKAYKRYESECLDLVEGERCELRNEERCICGTDYVEENLLSLKKLLRKTLKRYAKAYGFNDSMVMNVRQMKQRTATFQMFKSAYDKDPETYERMNEKRKAGEITAQEFDSWAYNWRESLFEQHALDDELVKNLKTLGVKDVILEEYEEYGATYTRGRMFY